MLVLLMLSICIVDGKYLFTLPLTMEAEKDTIFCLTFNGLELESDVKDEDYNIVVTMNFVQMMLNISEENVFKFAGLGPDRPILEEFYTCQKFLAPQLPGQYNLSVIVAVKWDTVGNSIPIFNGVREIQVRKPKLITLIQTDKPIYKAGQVVKFRVMTMSYMLMPSTYGYHQITIETPTGLRVMQWNDVPAPSGLVSLEMPLSSEPVLGIWKILVTYKDQLIEETFKVDEYVLPKFEVTITPPTYLLTTSKNIHGKVCAKYTYGKPVQGSVKIHVCINAQWHYYSARKRPCVDVIGKTDKTDGCYEFFVNAADIKLSHSAYSVWGSELKINATVTEDNTGIELTGESMGPQLSISPLTLTLEDDSSHYYKPGFPYRGRVVVKNPDGSPAIGEAILVEGTDYKSQYQWQRNFTSDLNGIVHFAIVDLDSNIESLSLTASAVVYDNDWRYSSSSELYHNTYTTAAYATLKKWFSPSDSYIYIPDIDTEVECDSKLNLHVYYSSPSETGYQFTAIVRAGDRIVSSKKITNIYDGQAIALDFVGVNPDQLLVKSPVPTPPLPPLPDLPITAINEGLIGPVTHYYEDTPVQEELIVPATVRPLGKEEGTVIKRRALPNGIGHFMLPIDVTWDMSPEAKVLVFYMREDKEVVATTIKFNVKGCFKNKVEMTFDETNIRPGSNVNLNITASPNSTCFVAMVDKSINLLAGYNQVTPKIIFDKIHTVSRKYSYISYWLEDIEYCSTKEKTDKSDHYYYSYQRPVGVDALQAFRDAEIWIVTDGVVASRPCRTNLPIDIHYFRHGGMGRPKPMGLNTPLALASNMKMETVEDLEKTSLEPEKIRSFFPETWLWDIFIVGADGTFAKEMTVPDTITEWMGNSLCTHPSDGVGVTELTGVTTFQPFFVSLNLPYSAIRGEMEITLRKMAGFQFSDLSGSSRQFCLCAGDSESTKFHIVPSVIGDIDIEATAVSIKSLDLCHDVVLSDSDIGVSDGIQRQLLIEAEGAPKEVTHSTYICVSENKNETDLINMRLPADLVLDSERATISVVGDIMGPTLSNLDNLLRMPYGCGEQNMASWSPNIYVLQYLSYTNQLSQELDEKAKGYMRVGYQRQLKYRHTDKSYSIWGENTYQNATGSLWLTAFVVKSMAQSTSYISIDDNDIVQSSLWLVRHQMTESGCFPRVGQVFSSYLMGGISDEDNPASLTAFTMIALLEAKLNLNFSERLLKASICLDNFPVADTDTYTLSLMFYAYTLYTFSKQPLTSKFHRRAEIWQELEKRQRTDVPGQVYWKRSDKNETKDEEHWYWYRAPSAEVEMTAYILLSKLEEGVIAEVQPIVQWLTRQRNSYGGFSSTQDTVVALQALAKFASLTYSGDTKVIVVAKHTSGNHVFSVSKFNSLVYQSGNIQPNSNPVTIAVSGKGCALVQLNMKYNVYTKDDGGPAFALKVGVYRSRRDNNKCSLRSLEVCTSYLKAGVSNMAIVEVKMPTGWTPVAETLSELLMSGHIQRYEVDRNYIQIYFDELTKQKTCVDFDVQQDIEMNPKPALVRVYDYYETGYSVTVEYEIKTTCGTKEEIPLENKGLDCNAVQCRMQESSLINVTDLHEPLTMTEVLMVQLKYPLNLNDTCPSCPNDLPDSSTLANLLCKAQVVYKAVVGRKGQYPVKIMANLRPREKVIHDFFVTYRIGGTCTCPLLEDSKAEAKAMILTSGPQLNPGEIWLKEGDYVLTYTDSMEKLTRNIALHKKLCSPEDI